MNHYLVPGVDQFSNENNFYLDQLSVETNTILKSSSCPQLYSVLYLTNRHSHKKLFAFENCPTPGTKSRIFRYFKISFLVNEFGLAQAIQLDTQHSK
jgi:hypothetical protein